MTTFSVKDFQIFWAYAVLIFHPFNEILSKQAFHSISSKIPQLLFLLKYTYLSRPFDQWTNILVLKFFRKIRNDRFSIFKESNRIRFSNDYILGLFCLAQYLYLLTPSLYNEYQIDTAETVIDRHIYRYTLIYGIRVRTLNF